MVLHIKYFDRNTHIRPKTGVESFGSMKDNVEGKYYHEVSRHFANVLSEIDFTINDKTQIISRLCRTNISIPKITLFK